MVRRSFGTVRRLPSGRWQSRYQDRQGAQQVAPSTFGTKTEASRWLAKLQADMDRGDYFDPKVGAILFQNYAAAWVTNRMVRGRPLAPRTAELYRGELKLHLNPTFGLIQLRFIDQAAVRAWHAEIAKNGPGASTVAKCYRLLRAIMQTAVEDGLIARNPCSIRGAGQSHQLERPLISAEQLDELIRAVPERWKALFLLAAWCGLRFGEIAALRKHRLDLESGTVTVAEAAGSLQNGKRHTGPPKTDAGRRTVAIPPHITPALRRHVANFSADGPTGLVFVGPKGAPINGSRFHASVWKPAKDSVAGIPGRLVFHDLRAWSATTAARHGATVKELQARLGHSTPAMALKYQRAEAVRDQALAAKMSEGH
jgi:integrase